MSLPDDSEIVPLCMDHNFWTWSAQKKVKPIPIQKADGVYFWDTAGKRYLDFNSMVMCVNIGHGNRHVIQSIQQQAQNLPFAGPQMATRPRAELGRLLTEITPGNIDHFLYTLGGADANENAIKLARAYSGRHKILARYRSYHGASLGALAATGDPRRVSWEPDVAPGVVHFLDPYRYRSTFHQHQPLVTEAEFSQDYLNHLEEIIQYEGPKSIAAILIEPITGTNGVIIPPEGYLQGVRMLCDRYGILLIADEVMSGFGRTGAWFGVDHWRVVPDLMTMAKGLTSGYAPLGAVGMTGKIAHFFDEKAYQGGLTYNGHPISLAAAIANIEVLQQDHLVENSARMGEVIHDLNTELIEKHPSVGTVRNIGCFGVIELVKDRKTKEPLIPFNSSGAVMDEVHGAMLEAGLFIYTHWHTILLLPPLCINEDQLREGFEMIDHVLEIADRSL